MSQTCNRREYHMKSYKDACDPFDGRRGGNEDCYYCVPRNFYGTGPEQLRDRNIQNMEITSNLLTKFKKEMRQAELYAGGLVHFEVTANPFLLNGKIH